MEENHDHMNVIDPMDLKILTILSKNGRTSYQEIANELNVSRVTIHERVKKLVNRGIISNFSAHINAEVMGYPVSAFVGLTTGQGKKSKQIIDFLQSIPEIEEIHIITGKSDVLIKIRAKNHKHLQEILFEKIGSIEDIERTETMVILSSPLEGKGFDVSQIKL